MRKKGGFCRQHQGAALCSYIEQAEIPGGVVG